MTRSLNFTIKISKKLLSEKGINLYSTENEEKSSVVERCKLFSASNSTVYIHKLSALLDKYNKTKHRSTKMTPEQANRKENEDRNYLNIYGQEMLQTAKPKFKVGGKSSIKDTRQTGQRKYLLLIRFNLQTR